MIRRPTHALRLAIALLLAGALPAVAGADPIDALAPGSRSAPGLGGDPFASELRTPRGWWAAAANARGEGVAFESSRPLLRGGVSGVEFGRDEWRASATETVRRGSRALHVTVARREPDWSASLDGRPVSTSAGAARAGVGLGLRIEPVVPGLTLATTIPAWSDRRQADATTAGFGTRYAAPGGLTTAQVAWTRSRETPRFDLASSGDRIATGTDLRLDGVSAECEIGASSWLAAELAFHRRWIGPSRPGARTPGHSLEVTGIGESWQSGLLLRPDPRLRLLLRNTTGHLEATADARLDGLRYGRMSYLRGRVESWMGAAEWRGGRARWLADVERLAVSGGGRASVEAWPFTSLLGDFLAARRNLIGSLEVRGWRAHAATARAIGRSAELRGGVELWDLLTEGSVVSWQPVLFGIGATDRRESRLPVHRAQLGALSLGAGFRVAGIAMSVDARQFVMARTFRNPSSADPASTTGSAPATTSADAGSGRGRGWPGGTSLLISIRRGIL